MVEFKYTFYLKELFYKNETADIFPFNTQKLNLGGVNIPSAATGTRTQINMAIPVRIVHTQHVFNAFEMFEFMKKRRYPDSIETMFISKD